MVSFSEIYTESTSDGLEQSPLKEFEEAAEGTFVKYMNDNKTFIVELNEENLKKPFYREFLGARKGGAIVVKRPVTEIEDVLSIERVMNKYLSLHDEILDQVANDPYSGIGMATITFDGTDLDSINETFKSLFGSKGTANRLNVEQELAKYYHYEITFSQIVHSVFRGDYLGAYHHLARDKGIVSIPLELQHADIVEGPEYVLDLTSLAIIFQVIKHHGITFDKKMVISRFIVDIIKNQLENEKLESKKGMSLTVTEDTVVPHFVAEGQKESNIKYLTDLLAWIEKNCNVAVSDRFLDFKRNITVEGHQQSFVDYQLNSLLLIEDKKNRVIVTDDSQYLKSGVVPRNKMISSERLLKTLFPDNSTILIEFVKNKYHGFSLSLEQLNEEYYKKLGGQHNSYIYCLQNINLLLCPNSSLVAIKHIKEIVLGQVVISEQLSLDVTNVFASLLKDVDPDIRRNIETLVKTEFSLLGHKYDLVVRALRDAYTIVDNY